MRQFNHDEHTPSGSRAPSICGKACWHSAKDFGSRIIYGRQMPHLPREEGEYVNQHKYVHARSSHGMSLMVSSADHTRTMSCSLLSTSHDIVHLDMTSSHLVIRVVLASLTLSFNISARCAYTINNHSDRKDMFFASLFNFLVSCFLLSWWCQFPNGSQIIDPKLLPLQFSDWQQAPLVAVKQCMLRLWQSVNYVMYTIGESVSVKMSTKD